MVKKILVLLIIGLFCLTNTSAVRAEAKEAGDVCDPIKDTCPGPNYRCTYYDSKTYLCLNRFVAPGDECNLGDPGIICTPGYDCQFYAAGERYICEKAAVVSIFGKIQPPPVLRRLLVKDPTGAGAISKFLSNGINLIYTIATIILIFMILWGAFEWLTSGGDKEKVASAQRRLINAFIGILLFAAAFAIISVLGAFTGFKFFEGQNSGYYCYNGSTLNRSKSPPVCTWDYPVLTQYPAVFCNDNQTWTGTVCKNR